MWILLFKLTFGLVASSWANSLQEVKQRGCSYRGVFHIQGNERYSLEFTEAQALCKALGTTLASNENVTAAYGKGLESCRYGWVSNGNITIPRHVSNSLCAGNLTGVITLEPTHSRYDAYCFDETNLSDINCTYEIKNLESDSFVEALSNAPISEKTESEGWNQTVPSTVVPEKLFINITVAFTETPHTMEKINSSPAISEDERNVSADVLNQNTQLPTMAAEVNTIKDDLDSEGPEHSKELMGVTEDHATIITSLDNNGSGMEETTFTITSIPDIEENYYTDTVSIGHSFAITTEDMSENPDQSLSTDERVGFDRGPAPEDSSSGSTRDWLVILLVVLAIAAIIAVAALVVMRNSWCGRSQTLMITSKNNREGNGTAASAASPQAQEREQEMVTLMNKEKIQENGNTEEFTVITLEESADKNQQA